MSVMVTKLKAEHLKTMIDRKGSNYLSSVTQEQARAIESAEHSYSFFVKDRLLLIGGVSQYWNGRGEVWAMFDPECKREFLLLFRAAKKLLEECPIRRIEANVDYHFEAGHRLALASGFRLDAVRLKGFLPDGKDATMYSMVKEVNNG